MSRSLVACDADETMTHAIIVDERESAGKTLAAIAEWSR
jgi:hypothetical protein